MNDHLKVIKTMNKEKSIRNLLEEEGIQYIETRGSFFIAKFSFDIELLGDLTRGYDDLGDIIKLVI